MPGAFGTAPTRRDADGRRPRAEPGHRRRATWSPRVTTDRPTRRAARRPRPSTSSPTTSASSRRSCATSSAGCHGARSCRPATPAAEVLAREPDGVFLSNGPGDPAAVGAPSTHVRDLLGQVPIFGICLGHQILAIALGGTTYKLPVRPPRRQPPRARPRRPARVEITTPEPRLRGRRSDAPRARLEVTHVNLNDGVVEGMRRRDAARPSACSTTPRPAPGPTTPPTCSTEFADLMVARRLEVTRCPSATTSTRSS